MLRSFVYSTVVAFALAVGIGSSPASADDWLPSGWPGTQDSSATGSKLGKTARARAKQRASRAALGDDSGKSVRVRPRATRKAKAQTEDDSRPAKRPTRTAKAAPGNDDRPRPSRRTARSSGGGGQTGVASFYWQPQRLATGGWFNPNAMTAAHRYLPFWTRVRVTHLANGRSVEVVINDRGPYIGGRIIDLSRAAAGVIGMQGQGIAQVRVEVLGR